MRSVGWAGSMGLLLVAMLGACGSSGDPAELRACSRVTGIDVLDESDLIAAASAFSAATDDLPFGPLVTLRNAMHGQLGLIADGRRDDDQRAAAVVALREAVRGAVTACGELEQG